MSSEEAVSRDARRTDGRQLGQGCVVTMHRLPVGPKVTVVGMLFLFFFSSRRRHTRFDCDWSSDVCSSDLRGTMRSLSPATVNFRNDTRAPLLLLAGDKDRIVPRSILKANFELYRESKEIGRASCRERV